MNVIRYTDADYLDALKKLTAPSSLFDPAIGQRAHEVVEAVRTRGDEALIEFTHRFDGATLVASQLKVQESELNHAAETVSPELKAAIELAEANIRQFSAKALRKGWSLRNAQGGRVGEKYDPFKRVGVYIPGGTAPLVSTVLMTVTMAKVAGCPEVVVCTPCNRQGEINPGILHAAQLAGATEIYRVGGAQAIAAMAHGTDSICKVQKIFGPGNAYVVAAKRLLFGHVAIDLLPGPSEVLILADDSAKARFIAADLLAQAEHGSGHERTWFLSTSAKLIESVKKEIERQLPVLSRKEFIEKSLNNCAWFIQVKTVEDAVSLANQLAPEHCEIQCRHAEAIAKGITTSGAICIGHYTPNVLGDYVAGPSHVLPTGGAGVSFAGLTVDQFQRRTSIIRYDKESLQKSLAGIKAFAETEGLDGHLRSASIRVES